MIRPPIVTILGHVDHGKTTLLDYVRKSRIAAKEHGGITQKIGAYEIKTGIKGYKNDKITFIDTPGHETFSKLRARGANVADIALLIIDAKDSLMPQTIESISHIQAAKIPFIVVLNKMDLPDVNPDKVKNDLLKYQVMVEGKGGTTPVASISAKTGQGVEELLEMILLITEGLNQTYDKKAPATGYIIETKKGKQGLSVSVVVKNGCLKLGDIIYADSHRAKIRSMINDLGQSINEVCPSTPVEIFGFETMPEVGSLISSQIKEKIVTPPPSTIPKPLDMDAVLNPVEKKKKLSLVIKTDSYGSLEAIDNSLINNDNLEIILKAVGDIHKSDIFLAKTTGSVVVGFNIKIDPEIKDLAKQEKVIIKSYAIIYELLEELNEVADLIKEKEEKERNLKGEVKILATFIIENERVFGVKITKGKINLNDQLEVYRNNNLFGKTKLVSLKVRAKRVNEVKKDQEAGMVLSPQLDIRVGDVVKSIL
jgi:translation initiation factor IF-2